MAHDTLLHAYTALWTQDDWRERTALIDATGSRRLSYGDLFEQVSCGAGALKAAGVAHGQMVAVAMKRSLESVVAIFSIMAAGACPCPLEPRLTRQEVADRLQSVGVTTVLSDAESRTLCEGLAGVSLIDADTLAAGSPYWCEAVRADDPGLLLFTSGSTGRPKGVLLSHRGLLNNARGVIPTTGLRPDDTLLHVMPLYHTNGLNNQLFSPFMVGARVVLAGRFRASDMPALMDQHRPSIITGVPTMYSRMLDQEFTPESLAALRFARCGSAPITRELHARIEAKLGCPLIVSYGLSEATCTSTINPPDQRKVGSIGKALPYQRVFLRHADGSEIATPDTDGEICIEGDSLMLGYLGTQGDGILEPPPATLRSGDLGRIDRDGYFYITGRLKDVIIRGGENISPALIEQVISSSPHVHSCCVVGRPDADLGEVPVAFVVPAQPGFDDAGAIQELVREQLSRIYRPEEVVFVDSLPENSVGKIDRKALQKRLAAAV